MEKSEDSVPLDSKLAPLLLFDYEETNNTQFFYSIPKKQLLAKSIDEMKKNSYWVTPQGWLFMLAPDSRSTFLWTPLTQQKIELPLAGEDFPSPDTSQCLLSEKPTDPNCIVLLRYVNDTIFWFCRPGGNLWFKHDYGHMFQQSSAFTSFNGKFCMYMCGSIITVEFTPNPTFTSTPIESSDCPAGYLAASVVMAESAGALFKISFCHPTWCSEKIMQIAVYKMDFSRKAWVRVDKLGDRAFFIDNEIGGVSCPARELGLKKNCIYFLDDDDKGLYVHDMESGTTTMHNPGSNLPDSFTPCFLMPVMT